MDILSIQDGQQKYQCNVKQNKDSFLLYQCNFYSHKNRNAIFKGVDEYQMDIHIRSLIEFEKYLDHHFPKAVNVTRQRMSIQQLLDQQEDKSMLKRNLEQYSNSIDNIIDKLYQTNCVVQQPCFAWSVNHRIIKSACWLFEALMPKILLSQTYSEEAHELLKDSEIKKANKLFKSAEKYYEKSMGLCLRWKWKLPHMNHNILHAEWHLSKKHLMKSFQHLCYQCIGIKQLTTANPMLTISTRALSSAMLSLAYWKNKDAETVVKIADGLRYLYHSHCLWNAAKYGNSIFTLQNWLQCNHIETGSFALLKEEFEKVPLLLSERIHTNNGAYFDKITAPDELPKIEDIICEYIE